MGEEDGVDRKRYRRVNFVEEASFPLAIDTKEEKFEIVGRLITFF